MKIAVPTANGKLCPHFGHCEMFAIIDADAESGTIGEIKFLEPPAHSPGVLPGWLKQHGADVVIAGGMGCRAQEIFDSNQIKVIVGAPVDKPEKIALAFLGDTLQVGENACDH